MAQDVNTDFNRNFISGIIVTTLFLLAHVFIPFLGIFISVLTPLPILFYYQKLGRFPGILIAVIASIIAIYFLKLFETPFRVFLIVEFGIVGLTLSEMLRRELSIEKTISYSVPVVLGAGVILASLYGAINFVNPWALVVQEINEKANQTIMLYRELGMPTEEVELFKAYSRNLANFLIRSFPSLAVVGTVVVIWMNLLIAKKLYRMRKLKFPDFGDLSEWEAPDILVWGVIIGGLLLVFGVLALKSVGLNILIISLCFFFFQGLAIVSYFFQRKQIPVILRGVGYLLIGVQQVFLFIVIGLGLFDIWADFRRLKKERVSR
ncbi:MAG: YybS family protein [Pseudomonadota bacterium]